MSPSTKFNAFLAAATVSIMFLAVARLVPILAAAGIDAPLVASLAALIASAGVYRLLAIALRGLMERIERVRALALGPYYTHGTWVGWFRGHTGELRFMVEHFVQDLDSLVITGRSYTHAKAEHGYWFSQSSHVDAKQGRLIFTYTFDVLTGSSSLMGIHSSLFERKSGRHAPTAYSGLAHDLNDKTRIAVHSRKVSTAVLLWDEALSKAVRLFTHV